MATLENLHNSLCRLATFLEGVRGFAAIGQNELAGLSATDAIGEGAILSALRAAADSWRASGQDGQAGRVDRDATTYASKAPLAECEAAIESCKPILADIDPGFPEALRRAVRCAWTNPAEALDLGRHIKQVKRWVGMEAARLSITLSQPTCDLVTSRQSRDGRRPERSTPMTKGQIAEKLGFSLKRNKNASRCDYRPFDKVYGAHLEREGDTNTYRVRLDRLNPEDAAKLRG